ncbi:uricase [Gasterosteus aculeatus]|uniref:uricase isoform X3 n=1 Tax=Gasterosteus aculeatus aculeatus TaxID=481459 RepID=UPI001A97EBA4|nr:uricase isoform X3 [Gasterosteus aculeatus aculeatus]
MLEKLSAETEGQGKKYIMAAASDQNVEFVRTGYGKNTVKVLVIRRKAGQHYIIELKADVELTLNSRKDYITGDNSDIIPTDTIKNTVHALAKIKGVKSIERFSLDICHHFLTYYNHVLKVKVHMVEAPWKRLEKNGVQHVHAFIRSPEAYHFCDVEQDLNGVPVVHSGLKDMTVLKTTQSGFEGFHRDRFTTLQEAKDRCFCTSVYARWRYNKTLDIDFDAAWKCVKETIIEKFAGPYDTGKFSPSVQKTLYETQVTVLDRVPEVDEIEVIMPNVHYVTIDMTKMGITNKDEVLLALDNPSGSITGTVCRKQRAKL